MVPELDPNCRLCIGRVHGGFLGFDQFRKAVGKPREQNEAFQSAV
jgi:hypothetical protein